MHILDQLALVYKVWHCQKPLRTIPPANKWLGGKSLKAPFKGENQFVFCLYYFMFGPPSDWNNYIKPTV